MFVPAVLLVVVVVNEGEEGDTVWRGKEKDFRRKREKEDNLSLSVAQGAQTRATENCVCVHTEIIPGP